ncbi:MAG: hypothetical protein L0Y60_01410 [Beijerinckiaceae bacterium]|nr:hypothetical protein [Beijerinckiaceae bacterium]
MTLSRPAMTPPILAAGQVQGVAEGGSHGPDISAASNLAAPATSNYSISFDESNR